jgi:hypothetical protein
MPSHGPPYVLREERITLLKSDFVFDELSKEEFVMTLSIQNFSFETHRRAKQLAFKRLHENVQRAIGFSLRG